MQLRGQVVRTFLALCGLSVAACASASDRRAANDGAPGERRDAAGNVVASGAATCRALARSAKASPERDAAVTAFTSGSLRNAIDALEQRLRTSPDDLAAQALLVATRTRVDIASKESAAVLERLPLRRLPPLSGDATFAAALSGATAGAAMKIDRVSDTPVAVLASSDDWIKKNGLKPALRSPRVEDLPDGAPQALGSRATALYSHADHEIVRYGDVLLATAPGRTPIVFDTKALQEVHFAQVVGRALLVTAWRNGYAKDVGGKTGQVAAFSIDDGKLLWASEPLVSSMGGFVVTKDHVISGYGFTAEPDHLFVLELATGKTVQKLALRSGPEQVLRNGEKIFVRTYDSEAVFKMSPAPGPAPAAGLPAVEASAERASAEVSCWVSSAVSAIDERDPAALGRAIEGLKAAGAAADVAGAFDGVHLFLEQQKSGARAIDLTTVAPKRLPKPPWVYTLGRAATGPVTAKPRLVQRAVQGADPARGIRRPAPRVDPQKPFFLAPVAMGQLPPGARPDIPSSYGLETLRAANPCDDGRLVLVYGGRYVAVVKGSDTEAVFDVESWRVPPRVSEDWKEFAVSDATFGVVEGNVLYLANGGGSYAREMFGSKGYVSAIDIRTGELLWRSQPLVQGGGSFDTFGDFLVTGYGFTGEGDFIYLLRKDTGQVVHKLAVKSAPNEITVTGNEVHVETYDAAVDLDVVP